MSSRIRAAHLAPALLFAAAILPAAGSFAATEVPRDRASAEVLLQLPAGSARDRTLRLWAERAALSDVLCVLRRSPAELGTAELLLVDAALQRSRVDHPSLWRRLLARAALAPGRRKPIEARELVALVREPVLHPYASVFDVAVLLPQEGDYENQSQLLLGGVETGLEGSEPACEIRVRRWNSGQDAPARAAAAFDSAARTAAVVIGELLSVPTFTIAAAAQASGTTVISPSAADEEIGTMGQRVFQIGPSGHERGQVLARAVLGRASRRVGVLVSDGAATGAFAGGFVAAAESLGSAPVWQERYSTGTANFRDQVRALVEKRVELLFWDGDPRELVTLLRQLARDRVSVRICGGEGLSPERHHAETRVLLEGVEFVGEEWEPTTPVPADSTGAPPSPLTMRGLLAGRAVRAALGAGALDADEVARQLEKRVAADPWLRQRRFLDVRPFGVGLSLYVVQRGRAVRS